MTKEQIMRRLLHHCSLNNISELKELLKSHPDEINIIESHGLYFGLAISNDSVEMLKVLLDFYSKTKLQCDHDSQEYLAAQSELCDILEEGIDSNEVSSEMQILINKYLYYDAYSDIKAEYNGDNEVISEDSDMSIGSSRQSSLTEENLKHWNELHMHLPPLELMGQSKTLVNIADQQALEIMSLGTNSDVSHDSIELSGLAVAINSEG